MTDTSDRLSVVVPCFNEEGNVRALVERTVAALDSVDIPFEIVLVDDASVDETWARISEMIQMYPNLVKGVRLPRNVGIWPAWAAGIDRATGEVVCLIDADLQNPPETLPQMWRAFQSGQSHVLQGVRSSIEWDHDARFVSSRGLNTILNIVFGDKAKDNKSGFVMAPKEILTDVLAVRGKYKFPQTFIRVAARAKGYQVAEIETLFQPRRSGKSFLSSRPAVQTYVEVVWDIARATREFGRGRRSPMDAISRAARMDVRSPHQYSGSRRVRLDAYFATMPVHAWLIRPRVKDIYLTLSETQWQSPEQLRDLQSRRLRRLMWHAYVHVPYYRRQFHERGLHPRDFDHVEDLAQFPMLSKQDVSEHIYFDLFSDVHVKSDMHKIATSGSTGQPFVTYADRSQLEVRFATTLRALEWTGWRIGDPQVRLWHQKLGMSPTQAIKERIDARFLRRTFIPAFEMTEEGLQQLAKKLNAIRPTLIDGYAESLNFLASYLSAGGSLDFRPKGVMSSAQTLTSGTRAQIEQGLGCRVFDKYGAREFSGIAYECDRNDGHHVMDESYIVEVLREGKPANPGETGEIVITDLNNFSFPLIRYRIGDLAVAMNESEACDCGRGLSRIGDIQGRTQALVHCANGRWIPGTFFAHFFKEYDYLVRFYQVVQSKRGEFTLRIVKGPHWTEESWHLLVAELRRYVGSTEILTEFVDSIPLLATGKRTPVVSSVRLDFQSL